MAKIKRARKKSAPAPEQIPLEGMADNRIGELDAAISEHLKAKSRAAKAKEEAGTALDTIAELMKTNNTNKYSYNGYVATAKEGKTEVKVKREAKKATAK